MNDSQVKHMVDRFLMWRLPENFNPDGGISFKAVYNEHTPYPMKHEPVGTNLFDATQAEDMVRYMVEGLPVSAPSSAATPCKDCEDAARHAYSDATTPGFFSPHCSKHKPATFPSPSAEQELIAKLVEALEQLMGRCSRCGGKGYISFADHAPSCDGACRNCPVENREQCDECALMYERADALLSEVAEYRKEKP